MSNWLVAFAMPIFLAKSSYGPYFLFGGLTFATVLILAAILPETRGVSLEAVEGVFQRPMKSWSYNVKNWFKSGSASDDSTSNNSHSSTELSILATGSNGLGGLTVEA